MNGCVVIVIALTGPREAGDQCHTCTLVKEVHTAVRQVSFYDVCVVV